MVDLVELSLLNVKTNVKDERNISIFALCIYSYFVDYSDPNKNNMSWQLTLWLDEVGPLLTPLTWDVSST